MKNKLFKKSMSVFLSVLMILSCWVWVPGEHNHASAADGTVNPTALTAIYSGSGERGDSGKIVICSDGEAGNTTVGHIRFNISGATGVLENATLTLNTGNHGGTLVSNCRVDIYPLSVSQCQATSGTYVVNSIATVYGGTYNAATGVTNALNYYGLTTADKLGTVYQNAPGTHTIDVTSAVNKAKAAGQNEVCFLFIMPEIFNDGNGNSWSDTHINVSGTSLSYKTYDFTPSNTGVPIIDINTDAANTVIGLSTDVTTIHGSFESDADYTSTANYDAVYHNVLYTDGPTTIAASATSAKTEYGNSWTGSNGVTIYWYHPTATLLYDGDTTDLPRLGVAVNIVMYYTGTWSRKSVNRLSYVSSGGNGFNFTQNWHGSDGRLNFQWMWHGQGEYMGYTSTVVNDAMRQTLSGNSDNHFYANLLKFTDTMGSNEYYRSATPTFAFYGDNGDSAKTITATSTDTIYIINYVPLRTAIQDAMLKLQEIKDYPAKYSTESVAEFVAAAKALVSAKPNNYINSSKNDVTGWVSAAETAVNNYYKVNLELATYDVTYENMFSFSSWANSASSVIGTPNKGTMTYDVDAGTITVNNNGANTQAYPNDHYTSHGFGNGHYNMTLVPGETYTFEYTTSGGTGDQVHIFFYDDNGNAVANPANRGNPFAHAYGTGRGTSTITFTAPENATKAAFRFGSTVLGDSITFSNIFMYSHTRGDYADIANWTNRPNRTVFDYAQALGTTLEVPERPGYTFDGWWVDSINPNGQKDAGEQVTDGNGTVVANLQTDGIDQDWVLYSEWTENKYNIAFNANGGSGSTAGINNVLYSADTKLTANGFSRTGYTFTGWNTKADGTGTAYADGATVSKLTATNGATVTLYAQWSINKYTVTFKKTDGTTTSAQYDYNTPAASITKPANTQANYDSTNHYTYSWPTINAVTGDVTYTEVKTPTQHSMSSSVTTNATCTTDGVRTYKCSGCAYSYTEAIPSTGHTEATKEENRTEATCGADGSYVLVTYCSKCNEELKRENKTIPATGVHTPGAAATCEAPQTCTVCGTELAAQLGHTEETIPAVPATCTATGLTEGKKCSVCGVVTVAQTVTEKIAHTEEVIPAVEATCTSTGLTEGKKCSVCGTVTVAQTEVAKKDHSLGEWITDKEPTCVTPGSKHKECEGCDYEETEVIPATGVHEYGEWSQFNNGTTHRRTCKLDADCTAYEEGTHVFNGTLRQLDDGKYHQYKCKECEAYGVGTNLNLREECFGDGTTFAQLDGNDTQHKETCKCGREKNDGHTYGDWIYADRKGTRECSECNYVDSTDVYTVTWVNYDGTVLETDENVHYGATPSYDGEEPEREATDEYTYTFAGWTPAIAKVTDDATYTAQFDSTVNEYTITFVNEDGTELQSGEVAYGETPSYTGETPTKAATAQYTYTFKGWTPAIKEVTGDATYTAQFDSTVNEYTITWVDGNGDTLKTEQVAYGETPAYTGETPTKTATAQYTYTFDNTWSPAIVAVDKDATYTAQFNSTVNEYTITFVNEDGTELQSGEVAYGETPSYTGETPTKAATAEYTYTFAGWSPEIATVTGDAEYTATFTAEKNSYTITWKNDDGSVIDTTTVEYGVVPTHADATKENTAEYTYTFAGWTPEVVAVTGDAEYTATFTAIKNSYTITWKNDDGSVIDTTTVEYGVVPTHADATKANTAEYTYTFAGWDPEVVAVTGDAEYTATFTAIKNSYTITWKNDDGSVLQSATLEFGSKVVYPSIPAKDYDEDNHYVFNGWKDADGNIINPDTTDIFVAGDATFTATFTGVQHSYEYAQKADKLTHTGSCECGKTVTENCSGGESDCENAAVCSFCGEPYGEARGHSYESEVTEPTCTDKGYTTHICSICDDSYVDSYVDEKGHDYEGVVTTEPGCETEGVMTYTCKNDNSHTYTDKIDPLDHIDENPVDGKCDRAECGKDICKHSTTTETARVEATCIATGNIQYWTCDVCGKHFSDADCKNLVADVIIAIDADAHKAEADYIQTVAPTCSAVGEEKLYCEYCDAVLGTREVAIDANAHKAEADYIQTVAPTCSAVGEEKLYCEYCDAVLDTREVAIDADAHKAEAEYIQTVAPTCSAVGEEKLYCEYCDAVLDTREVAIDADAHKAEAEYIQTVAPTCTAVGEEKLYCEYCDAVLDTREVAIDADAHKAEAEYIQTVAPTCSAVGEEKLYCEYCDAVLDTRDVAIDADAHKAEAEYVQTVAPTCSAVGEEKLYCEYCDAVLDTREVAIDADAHKAEAEYIQTVAPTCTAVGEEKLYCEYCDAVLDTREVAIDANAHKAEEEYIQTEAPTCSAVGEEKLYCEYCDAVLDTREVAIDADAHKAEAEYIQTVAPTCSAVGEEKLYCEYCDAVLDTREVAIDADAHKAEAEYIQTVAPTCSAVGEEKLYCEYCDAVLDTREVAIDADAHKAEAEYIQTVAPTCSAVGEEKLYCEYCDAVLDTREVAIDADAHKAEAEYIQTVAPTCSAVGEEKLYCEYCDAVLDTREVAIDADAHKAEAEYIQTVAPTCSAVGEEKLYCEYCDAVLDTREVAIDATNHEGYNEEVSRVDSTCSTKGSVTMKCACGDVKITELELDANAHNYIATVIPATCTEDGYTIYSCVCGDSYKEDIVPATGKHSFGEWILVEGGDCSTGATYARTCSVCDEEETKTVTTHTIPVDKNGNYLYSSYKQASCTNAEYYTYFCEICGKEERVVVGEPLGHEWKITEVSATCTKNGYILRECAVCNGSEKEVLEKLGHAWVGGTADKAPTCTEDGYENYVYCMNCGDVHYDVVSRTGHKDADNDGKCDSCLGDMKSGNCGCFCHSKNWFIHIIYSIIRFIWKIFGTHQTCVCDALHY